MKKYWLILAIMMMIGEYAYTAIITKNLDVSASVQQSVIVDVTGDVCFGEYDAALASYANGNIRLIRASTATEVLAIKLSPGAAGTYTNRMMGGVLSYNLYRDVAYTEVWGDDP